MGHTPEPWIIEGYSRSVRSKDGGVIAKTGLWFPKEQNEVNRIRIAQCVNACAGIENPKDAISDAILAIKCAWQADPNMANHSFYKKALSKLEGKA